MKTGNSSLTVLVTVMAFVAGGCSACEQWLKNKVEGGSELMIVPDAAMSSDAGVAPPDAGSVKQHTEEQIPRIMPADQLTENGLLKAQVLAWCKDREANDERVLIRRTLGFREELVRAASYTGVDVYILAGIAMTESRSGVFLRSDRDAIGVMQVLKPSAEALRAVKQALAIENIDWQNNHFHNIVLGASIAEQYMEARGSVEFGLVAYHNGPNAPRLNQPRETSTLAEFQTQVLVEKCHKGKKYTETDDVCRRRKEEIMKYPLEVLCHAVTLKAAIGNFGDTFMAPSRLKVIHEKLKDKSSVGDERVIRGTPFPGIDTPWRSGSPYAAFQPPAPISSLSFGDVNHKRRSGQSLERVVDLYRTRLEYLKQFNGDMPLERLRKENQIVVPGRNLRLVYDVSELAPLLYPDLPSVEALRNFVELNRDQLRYNSVITRPIVEGMTDIKLEPKDEKRVTASIRAAQLLLRQYEMDMKNGLVSVDKRKKKQVSDPPASSTSGSMLKTGVIHAPPAAE